MRWGRGADARPADPADALTRRAAALIEAVAQADDVCDPAALARARDVAARVGERMALSGRHVVVALAGSTGAGKSSLFNALVGEDVAETGVRRPTTSQPRAAVWGDDPASALLDWLGIAHRHRVTAGPEALAGLVLVDLPDVDSRVLENRAEADRVLALVDLFVWVTDHQKYADAVIHDQYIAVHRDQHRNTLVVLNHADELGDAQLPDVREDLTRLVARDGLDGARVIATSARTGLGVDDLRDAIAGVVANHKAALRRLGVDLDGAVAALRAGLGTAPTGVPKEARSRLVHALARAAGVPVALDAVGRSYRREALRHTGLVFTRWRSALRADPLARLRLNRRPAGDMVDEADVRAVLGRSSMPEPTAAARADVDLATRDLAAAASHGLPPVWVQAVEHAAHPADADLRDALDQALVSRVSRHRTPAWWRLVSGLQWLCAAAVVAGVAWYIALGLAGWLQFVLPDVPRWGPVPYPFLLIVGGLGVGLLVSLVSRSVTGAAAGRRRRAVAASLDDAIGGVADAHVIAPVEAVLARHRALDAALAATAGRA